MVAPTSAVLVVAMVCLTIGWSLPNMIGPHDTVRVFRRTTECRSSQYLPRGP
jgi:hypothetical protein